MVKAQTDIIDNHIILWLLLQSFYGASMEVNLL